MTALEEITSVDDIERLELRQISSIICCQVDKKFTQVDHYTLMLKLQNNFKGATHYMSTVAGQNNSAANQSVFAFVFYEPKNCVSEIPEIGY